MEPMNELTQMGRFVAEHEDALSDQLVDLQAVRQRFLQASDLRSKPSWARFRWAAAIAVAAGIALFTFTLGRARTPLTFLVGDAGRLGEVDAWLAAPVGGSLPLRFSDGSAVRLEASARARVTRLANAGATLRMETGHADVSVAKRTGAAWQVSLGPFRVDVTGTRFAVDWDPQNERLVLTMHEGTVIVSGCTFGAGRPFVAGDTVRTSCRDRNVELSTRTPPSASDAGHGVPGPASDEPQRMHPSEAANEESSIEVTPPASGPRPRSIPPSGAGDVSSNAARGFGWQELARSGHHALAVDAAEAAGFTAECAAASAADLVALGDAARYVGRLERAAEAYSSVRRRFPGQERAAVAAFALGRIAFDQRADYASAARWFRAYLDERPGGRLDRDALGRLMESLNRAGDAAGARQQAQRYLGRYPMGAHAEMARRLLAQ